MRAYSGKEILNMNFKTVEFDGEFYKLIGKPELSGTWLIWGGSANGKTRFAIQLAVYLSQFDKVVYNPLEEGITHSLKKAVKKEKAFSNIKFLNKETLDELRARLQKQKSPRIIITDSLQYTGLKYADYIKLKEEFPKKLFIFISHAEGKEPAGRVAKSVRYDADVKIRIEGFKAFADSRYLDDPSEPYTIWEKGAEEYWIK